MPRCVLNQVTFFSSEAVVLTVASRLRAPGTCFVLLPFLIILSLMFPLSSWRYFLHGAAFLRALGLLVLSECRETAFCYLQNNDTCLMQHVVEIPSLVSKR